MNDRLILTDCDGVLCNWIDGFESFIQSRGLVTSQSLDTSHYCLTQRYGIGQTRIVELIEEFNASTAIADLDCYLDSKEYVTRLASQGFRFTVISALGSSAQARRNRVANLEKHFGNVFEDIICLPLGDSKRSTLSNWASSGRFWLEDHPEHALAGAELGLRSVLFLSDYTAGTALNTCDRVSKVSSWKDLHSLLNSHYNCEVGSLPGC